MLGTPSGGLVDVDLDSPEAVCLAPHVLPETGATFGRASKPRSHFLYIVPEAVGVNGEASDRKPSQASRLVALASSVDFFHTPEGKAFARVRVGEHIETASVKSGAFRDWLVRAYRQAEKRIAVVRVVSCTPRTITFIEAKESYAKDTSDKATSNK